MDFDTVFLFLVIARQRAVFVLIRSRQIIALQPYPATARLSVFSFLMEAAEPTAEARRKAPPCGNPRCESPGDNVRLQFIPAGFAGEVRAGATCFHLKRADCRRHFMGGEPGSRRRAVSAAQRAEQRAPRSEPSSERRAASAEQRAEQRAEQPAYCDGVSSGVAHPCCVH